MPQTSVVILGNFAIIKQIEPALLHFTIGEMARKLDLFVNQSQLSILQQTKASIYKRWRKIVHGITHFSHRHNQQHIILRFPSTQICQRLCPDFVDDFMGRFLSRFGLRGSFLRLKGNWAESFGVQQKSLRCIWCEIRMQGNGSNSMALAALLLDQFSGSVCFLLTAFFLKSDVYAWLKIKKFRTKSTKLR